MIRVMVVDDHPSMREGLTAVLDQAPDLEPVGTAANVFDAWTLYKLARPDVVLLDFHLPGENSLRFAHALKQQLPAPKVLMHSAYAGPVLDLGALVAGADGVLDKGIETRDLFQTVRDVAGGARLETEDLDAVRAAAHRRLEGQALELAIKLADGTPRGQVADALGINSAVVSECTEAMLDALAEDAADAVRRDGLG